MFVWIIHENCSFGILINSEEPNDSVIETTASAIYDEIIELNQALTMCNIVS